MKLMKYGLLEKILCGIWKIQLIIKKVVVLIVGIYYELSLKHE